MVHYISKLIQEGEHQQLDFKFEIADAHKIARTLVAFANADGGRLLIGVNDNGTLAGIRSEEEWYMVEQAAKRYCNPSVAYSFKEWHIKKKTILEIIVRKSSLKPHFAQDHQGSWKSYHRVGDQNLIVSSILLRVWKGEKKQQGVFIKFTGPEKFLLSYLETNKSITLASFASLAGISNRKAETILVKFILLRMVRLEDEQVGRVGQV